MAIEISIDRKLLYFFLGLIIISVTFTICSDVYVNYNIQGNDIYNVTNVNATSFRNSTGDLDWIRPENVFDIDDEDIETDLNTYVDVAGDVIDHLNFTAGNVTMNDTGVYSNDYKSFARAYDKVICRAENTADAVYKRLFTECDVVCSDDDCSDEIDGVMDWLRTNGGGSVLIKTGEYNISSPYINASFISNALISGEGKNSTIIRQINSGNDGISIGGNANNRVHNIILKDIGFDLKTYDGSAAVGISSADYVTLLRVRMENLDNGLLLFAAGFNGGACDEGCIVNDTTTNQLLDRGNKVIDCDIISSSTADVLSWSFQKESILQGNRIKGRVSTYYDKNIVFDSNEIYESNAQGIYITSGMNQIYSNNNIENTVSDGIIGKSSPRHITITGNTFYNISGGEGAINFDPGSKFLTINGNTVNGTKQSGFDLRGDYMTVSNNILENVNEGGYGNLAGIIAYGNYSVYTNNVLIDTRDTKKMKQGVRFDGVRDVIFSGNHINGSVDYCMEFSSKSSVNVSIHDNYCGFAGGLNYEGSTFPSVRVWNNIGLSNAMNIDMNNYNITSTYVIPSTTRPVSVEGIFYYNNTAGYKCLQFYNSTHWICNTGTETKVDAS